AAGRALLPYTTLFRSSKGITLGVALAGGLWSSSAEASGFAAARFGGEHGHPTTDNATAIYYNPAGIALSKGTHVFVDATMALRRSEEHTSELQSRENL